MGRFWCRRAAECDPTPNIYKKSFFSRVRSALPPSNNDPRTRPGTAHGIYGQAPRVSCPPPSLRASSPRMTGGGPNRSAIDLAERQLGFLVVIDLVMQMFSNMTFSGVGLLTVPPGVSDAVGRGNAIPSSIFIKSHSSASCGRRSGGHRIVIRATRRAPHIIFMNKRAGARLPSQRKAHPRHGAPCLRGG
jgi:hypothetical protein